MTAPPYDGSDKARKAHARLLASIEAGRAPLLSGPPPTASQLEKHAARFGKDQVAETAAEVGAEVDLTGIVEPRRPRRRRR